MTDGEGYGASHASDWPRTKVPRTLDWRRTKSSGKYKGKTYRRSKKRPDSREQETLYGWWLAGDSFDFPEGNE